MEANVELDDLPFELLELIFSFLPPAALISPLCVNRKWFDLARSDQLWRLKTLQYLGNCSQELRGKKKGNRRGSKNTGGEEQPESRKEIEKADDRFSYFRFIQQKVKECNAIITSVKAYILRMQVTLDKPSIVSLIGWAAQNNCHVLLRKWIAERFGKLGASIEMPDIFGYGLAAEVLIKATLHGRTEIVKIFIEHGAQHNTRDYRQNILIAIASRRGHVEIVKYLLEVGGLPPNKSIEYMGRRKRRWGSRIDYSRPAFHQAAQGGSVPVLQAYVDYLHANGLSGLVPELLTSRTGQSGKTPLFYAVSKGHVPAMEWFLAQGARLGISTTMRTLNGRTLLSAAVASKKVAMVKFILDKGLAFAEPKESGLYDACLGAKFGVIELLLHQRSVPLGMRDRLCVISAEAKHTLVWAALHRRPPFPRLVHYLIDEGADLSDALEGLFTGPYRDKPCAVGILEKLLLHDSLPQPWNSVSIDKHPLIILVERQGWWQKEHILHQLVERMLARVDEIDHPLLIHCGLVQHDTIFRSILSTAGAQRCLQHDPGILQGIPAWFGSALELKNLETLLAALKEMGKEAVLRNAQTYPCHMKTLQLLAKYGADLEKRDAAGWTTMMLHYREHSKRWTAKETAVRELQKAAQCFRDMGARDLTLEDMTLLEEWASGGGGSHLRPAELLSRLREGLGFPK